MPASARVVSCFEAGRDGFWLHWNLVSIGIENQVVDAARIEVSRRLRHVTTDRLADLPQSARSGCPRRIGWYALQRR